jgi:hypothetical protein
MCLRGKTALLGLFVAGCGTHGYAVRVEAKVPHGSNSRSGRVGRENVSVERKPTGLPLFY